MKKKTPRQCLYGHAPDCDFTGQTSIDSKIFISPCIFKGFLIGEEDLLYTLETEENRILYALIEKPKVLAEYKKGAPQLDRKALLEIKEERLKNVETGDFLEFHHEIIDIIKWL